MGKKTEIHTTQPVTDVRLHTPAPSCPPSCLVFIYRLSGLYSFLSIVSFLPSQKPNYLHGPSSQNDQKFQLGNKVIPGGVLIDHSNMTALMFTGQMLPL